MKEYSIHFTYNDHGAGPLILRDPNGLDILSYDCRSGSLNESGEFTFDPLPVGEWLIKEMPVGTNEQNMYIEKGNGWKVRLYQKTENNQVYYKWTSYLIHPAKHGTKGCIGIIGTDAVKLRNKIVDILKFQSVLPVYVEREDV